MDKHGYFNKDYEYALEDFEALYLKFHEAMRERIDAIGDLDEFLELLEEAKKKGSRLRWGMYDVLPIVTKQAALDNYLANRRQDHAQGS